MKPGQNYARLTAVAFSRPMQGDSSPSKAFWRFRCVCGTEFEAVAASVKYGRTRSCGCIVAENNRERARLLRAAKASQTNLKKVLPIATAMT